MPIKNTYYVDETINTTTDVVLNNHVLSIVGLQPMDYRKIETYSRVVPSGGTLGKISVIGLGGTAGNQSVVVSQYVKSLGKVVSATIQFNGTASSTNNDVLTAFTNQLGLLKGFNFTVTNNATHVIIEGKNPDNFLSAQSVGTVSVAVNNSVVTAAARAGYGADLAAEGFAGVINTNYYVRYDFVYGSTDPKGTAGSNDYQVSRQTLLLTNGAATALNATTTNVVDQLIVNLAKGQVSNSTAVVGTSEGISLAD